MYDIRQFRPALFTLVMLAVAGFSLAAESPMLWVLGSCAVLANAWMVWRGTFKPMPRILSNLITIGALLYVVHEVLTTSVTAVIMIGEFLMLLVAVKLWEHRGNRDHAQLLILSLLLMVAAAITTPKLIFGVMMIGFLFLALYCCLLFHLKVETDEARAAAGVLSRRTSAAVVRQDQRYFTRSMRRLTVVVSAVALLCAVLVFLLYPRNTGANMLGPAQFQASLSLVGFTDEVSFQNIARIQQNDTIVGYVTVHHNGTLVKGGSAFPSGALLLRGVTLDTYTGKQGGYRWQRWPRNRVRDGRYERTNPFGGDSGEPENEPNETHFVGTAEKDHTVVLGDTAPATPQDQWLQDIKMLPTGTDVMFAIAGAYQFKPHQSISWSFSTRDGEMRNISQPDRDHPPGAVSYEITSTNTLGDLPPLTASGTDPRDGGVIDKAIRDYALRADVCGADAAGSLGSQRYARFVKENPATTQPSLSGRTDFSDLRRQVDADDLDEQIADHIEHHLKTTFGYTLDLTDTRRIEGRDPLVAFLYDFKKGHCEYFAGAMTLLCQSLGMKARMVAGFRCDEYNDTPGADYFMVRQSHAHTWVEVYTKNGWKTYDPTSGESLVEQSRSSGLVQTIKHFFNFLEFSYGNAVIAYSNDDRTNLIQKTETQLIRAAAHSSIRVDRFRHHGLNQWLVSSRFYQVTSVFLAMAIGLIGAVIVGITLYFGMQRWRLRRRAQRIGIAGVPESEQLRLARQLEFYDDLIRLLNRHAISRRPSQTPLEFSESLLFLPAGIFDTISRLTALFYKIRYGRVELSPAMRQRLGSVVDRLTRDLQTLG